MRKIFQILLFALLAPFVFEATAEASPDEYEQEVVESLLLADNPSAVPSFLFSAPASECTLQGVRVLTGCADVVWSCPDGMTAGALTRLRVPYEKGIMGFQSRLTMCVEGALIPNPQPGSTPVPVVIADVPVAAVSQVDEFGELAFTGPSSPLAVVLSGVLLGAGCLVLGVRRRLD